jgi:hypothetical protein
MSGECTWEDKGFGRGGDIQINLREIGREMKYLIELAQDMIQCGTSVDTVVTFLKTENFWSAE